MLVLAVTNTFVDRGRVTVYLSTSWFFIQVSLNRFPILVGYPHYWSQHYKCFLPDESVSTHVKFLVWTHPSPLMWSQLLDSNKNTTVACIFSGSRNPMKFPRIQTDQTGSPNSKREAIRILFFCNLCETDNPIFLKDSFFVDILKLNKYVQYFFIREVVSELSVKMS